MSKRPTGFRSGDWLIICDRCGFTIMASETKHHYDGLITCKECYETRHPQELLRVRKDRIVPPFLRPEPEDGYIEHTPFTVAITGVTGTGSIGGGVVAGISVAASGVTGTGSVGTVQIDCQCVTNAASITPPSPYEYKWYAGVSTGAGKEVVSCWRNATAQGQGDAPNFAYSTDHGQTWTMGTISSGSSTDYLYNSVKWNGTWFVACAYANSVLARSQDGINWAVTAVGTFIPWGNGIYNTCMDVLPNTNFYGVYGNFDNDDILISTDNGSNWTSYNVLPHSGYWTGVANNGTNVVAVGSGTGSGGTSQAAYKDIANITSAWTAAVLPSSAAWEQIIWDGTYFVATANTNTPGVGARSLTGATWEAITLPTQAHQGVSLKDIANYGNLITDDRGNLWLGVWRLDDLGTPTTVDTFFCSQDHGTTWTEKDLPTESMWLVMGWSGYRLWGVQNRTDGNTGTAAWYSDER